MSFSNSHEETEFREREVYSSWGDRETPHKLRNVSDDWLAKELTFPLMLNSGNGNPNSLPAILDMAREQGYRARMSEDRKALEERERRSLLDEPVPVRDATWRETEFPYIRPYEWPHMRLRDLSAEELDKGVSGRFDGNFTLKEIKLLQREAGYRQGQANGST